MIWFTADHHFNHANIIKYCNRPFSSVDEMNNELVRRWNEVIKPDDTVYHLGDFTLEGVETFYKFFMQLNGKILIIPGGHDYRWTTGEVLCNVSDPLISIELDTGRKFPLVIVLCHYAMRVWDRSHYGSLHLYGHSHGNLEMWPNSMDVGVDCHNYYPVSLDTVLEVLK